MIRIVFVQSNPVYGACEEYLSLLIRGLSSLSYDIALVCPDAKPLDRLAQEVTPVAQVVRNEQRGHTPRRIWELTGLLRRLRSDVIHVNDRPVGMSAAACRLSRTVLTYHAAPDHRYNEWPAFSNWAPATGRSSCFRTQSAGY
jgi:hypothetical protein